MRAARITTPQLAAVVEHSGLASKTRYEEGRI